MLPSARPTGAQGNQEAGEARRRTARSLTGVIFAMEVGLIELDDLSLV
jgi:hypothetical protein